MVSRTKLQYCKIILATSMVWFLLDVFLLMYYTDCAANGPECNKNKLDIPGQGGSAPKANEGGGFLNKLIPKGN